MRRNAAECGLIRCWQRSYSVKLMSVETNNEWSVHFHWKPTRVSHCRVVFFIRHFAFHPIPLLAEDGERRTGVSLGSKDIQNDGKSLRWASGTCCSLEEASVVDLKWRSAIMNANTFIGTRCAFQGIVHVSTHHDHRSSAINGTESRIHLSIPSYFVSFFMLMVILPSLMVCRPFNNDVAFSLFDCDSSQLDLLAVIRSP